MSPKIFDWSKLIAGISDEAFGFPADVVFQIVEDGEFHEVKAHKTILAMVSLPFKTMFTTDVGDRTAKEIKIEQTTAPAFQIMIDAIYEVKSIEESLKGKSVQEVFDVIQLIEQYQIAELAEAMEKYLDDYPVDDDSVLEVAAEATQFTTLFQKEAKQLLLTCAKFLRPKLKDAISIFDYAAKADQKEVFSILLGLMGELPPPTEVVKCPNCGYENCQDGEPINEGEFRVGLIVSNNKASDYWGVGSDWGIAKVTSVDAQMVRVDFFRAGIYRYGDEFYNKTFEANKTFGGKQTFLFFCK